MLIKGIKKKRRIRDPFIGNNVPQYATIRQYSSAKPISYLLK